MIETHIAITAIVLVSLFGLIALKLEQKATQLLEERVKMQDEIINNQDILIESYTDKISELCDKLKDSEEIKEHYLNKLLALDKHLRNKGEDYEGLSKESIRDKKEQS